MNFPVYRHATKRAGPRRVSASLAAEPFRLFFVSGALWSIAGVALWPLFYAGKLAFYPGITHARLMIECFGGAFVTGFLGTAGPRMASAPRLTIVELAVLFGLHIACGVQHLKLHIAAADACFLWLLILLFLCLAVRLALWRREPPPPQMLLALAGLLCGIAGTVMWLNPEWLVSLERYRLAGLLVYQGLLLLPVLGIGSFIFPRVLGGEFGEPATPAARRAMFVCALAAVLLIVGSFFIEIIGATVLAYSLRSGTAAAWLILGIRWRRTEDELRGTLAHGLYWALGTGLTGLAAAGFAYERHVALEHLLYIGAFGLLILIVGSRVVFGHSGDLPGFSRRSWLPRTLIALTFVAAATRASADFWPRITVSHHKYAAWAWGLTALLWLVWHRRRFVQREDE